MVDVVTFKHLTVYHAYFKTKSHIYAIVEAWLFL